MSTLDRFASARPALWLIAVIGGVGLNGVFLYYALAHPGVMLAALQNPVALVFILEAGVLMGVLAWMIQRAGWTRPGWKAFLLLSIAGSLACSVPAFLLWHLRARRAGREEEA